MKLLLTTLLLTTAILVTAQPINDDCSGLIDLGILPACPDDIFTNVGATSSDIGFGNIPGCFNGGTVENDVWFSFLTSDDQVDISISLQASLDGPNAPIQNPQIALYRGDCTFNGLAELACISADIGETSLNLTVLGLTPNLPYFLRVNDYSPSATPNWGDFQLCLDTLSFLAIAGVEQDSICAGESTQLTLTYGNNINTFAWTPEAFLSDPESPEPIASPLSTTTYTVMAIQEGNNLISNGDFEDGNTGFTTDYLYGPDIVPIGMYGVLSEEGTYSVESNPSNAHINFAPCPDHTTGNGNMLVLNGSGTVNENLWCQTVTVEPHSNYLFSAWVTSVTLSNPAVLQFSINGNLLELPFNAPFGTCNWVEFSSSWDSGLNTSAEICITNQNTQTGGNDFAIDDILFRSFNAATDSVTVYVSDPEISIIEQINATCAGICNGSISLEISGGFIQNDYQIEWSNGASETSINNLCGGTYTVTITDDIGCSTSTSINILEGSIGVSVVSLNTPCEAMSAGSAQAFAGDGTPPYSFLWDNGEDTEIATNLTNGDHQVTVTDASGCMTVGSITISVDPTGFEVQIEASADTICIGEILTLAGIGASTSSLEWSTGATSSTINVNPSSTTTYTLTAVKNGENLIVNGDFEAGAVGFTSDYGVGLGGPWGPLSDEGTYDISNNPTISHSNFASCVDHTSGTGNMMVINGSITINQNIWCQTLTISPNTDYMFSTWIATMISENPAILQFSINGQLLGIPFNAPLLTCEWQEFFEIWNSGNSTTAEICIVNQNIFPSGNDFALDDIALVPICESQDEITIVVSDPTAITEHTEPDCFGNPGIATVATNNGFGPFSFLWSTTETEESISFFEEGAYSVTTTDAFGCEASASFLLEPQNNVSLNIDSVFQTSCEEDNGSLYLSASGGTPAYLFSINGGVPTESNTFANLAPGDYQLLVQDEEGCEASNLVNIASSEALTINIAANPDTLICEEEITLEVGNFEIYEWSDGSNSSELIINEPGEYSVFVIDADGCEASATISITECGGFDVPNIFTPNGDGVNDLFGVVFKGNVNVLDFKIYNRWGTLVHDSVQKWDGTYNGQLHPSDVLVYRIHLETIDGPQTIVGDVTLLR